MLCKELQISDWIADNNGFQWQIICVGDDYAYATFEGNEGDPWEFDDEDEHPYAIELTEAILERNGWKQSSTKKLWVISILREGVENPIYMKYDQVIQELVVWYDYIEAYNHIIYADMIIRVTFVHELQHALRLAGLNDVANVFTL